MKTIHACLLTVALAACAAPASQWEKPGASQAAVQEDSARCRDEARLTAPGSQLPSPTITTTAQTREEERELSELVQFQKCMREKGYSTRR